MGDTKFHSVNINGHNVQSWTHTDDFGNTTTTVIGDISQNQSNTPRSSDSQSYSGGYGSNCGYGGGSVETSNKRTWLCLFLCLLIFIVDIAFCILGIYIAGTLFRAV